MEEKETIVIDVQLSAEGVANQLAEVNEKIAEVKAQNASMRKEVKDGTKTWKEVSGQLAVNEQRLKTLSTTQKVLSNQFNAQVGTNKRLGDSLKEMGSELTALKNEYRSLSEAERNSAKGQDLLKHIQDLDAKMKSADASMGDFQRNVGNYENAIKNILGTQNQWFDKLTQLQQLTAGGLKNSVSAATTAVKGLGKQLLALMANPIVLAIAAIAAAFKLVSDAVKNNEENMDRWKTITAPIGRVAELLSNIMQQLAGKILSVVEAGGALLGWIGKMMEKIPVLGDYIKDFNDEMNDSIALEKEAQDIRDAHRAEEVAQAEASLKSQRLLTKAYDKANYSAKERLEFLRQATKIEQDRADAAEQLAKRELELARKRASISKNDSKTNDDLAQKEAAYYQALQQREALQTSLKRRESQLLSQIASETKEAAEKQKQANEEVKKSEINRINAIREAEDAIISLMNEGREKKIAIENSQYKKSKELLELKINEEKTKHGESTELYKAYLAQLEAIENAHVKKLLDIDKETEKETLQTRADEIARTLSMVEKGSIEELNLRIKALTNKRDQELLNENLTDTQRLLIEKQYQKDLDKIDQEYEINRQAATRKALENRIAEMKLSYQKTGELELQLLKENIDNLMQLQGESDAEFYARKLAAQQAYVDKKKAIDAAEMAIEKAKADYMSNIAGSISGLLETVAGENEEMVKASKVIALAEVAIKQGMAIAEAVASSAAGDTYTYTLRVASAIATTIAAMDKAIASINSAKFETGGVIGGFHGATSGHDNTFIQARRGEMILNAQQQRELYDIANGGAKGGSTAAALAEALRNMPAPVLVYEEFSRFGQKIVNINELTKLQ